MSLEVLTSDLLASRKHGFFTRRGGCSSGIFEGLNCGIGSSDQISCVSENRARVAEWMGVDEIASLHQIHSADVVVLDKASSERPKADAMVTQTKSVALGILTADCAPVLFAGDGIVGAAHAGWKGAIGGVLDATVAKMRTLAPGPITAVIGPTIAQSSYEVGQDFMGRFVTDDPSYTAFFEKGRDAEHFQFNLPAFILDRLSALGVKAGWTGHDTYSDPRRFYSFRRTTHRGEADYGRLISAIRL